MMNFNTLGQSPMQAPVEPMRGPEMAAPMEQAPEATQMPQGIASQEQMDELKQLLVSIEQKFREHSSDKMASDNAVKSSDKETLDAIFQLLKEAGVDLNDQQSINTFLSQLQQSNPDTYQMFIEVLDNTMDPETPAPDNQSLDLSQVPEEGSEPMMMQ